MRAQFQHTSVMLAIFALSCTSEESPPTSPKAPPPAIPTGAGPAVVASVTPTPTPDTAKPTSEKDKIQALLDAMRDSGFTVIRNGTEYDSEKGASHLQRKVNYAGDRLKTAEQFIIHIASSSSRSGRPYLIRKADGTTVLAGEWFYKQLALIHNAEANSGAPALKPDPRPSSSSSDEAVVPTTDKTVVTPIEQALRTIATSSDVFVVDGRKGPPKTYTGPEFADILRLKSNWLGSGITDYAEWVDRIATRSYKSYKPYRVHPKSGSPSNATKLQSWLKRNK